MPVRIKAGSKQNAILGIHKGALHVAMLGELGLSDTNVALIKYLSIILRIWPGSLTMVSGNRSQSKIILIEELDCSQIRERLAAAEKQFG